MGATAVAILGSLPALAVIAQPAPDRLDYQAEEFDRGVEGVPGALQVKSGFTPGIYGWNLGPGLTGELTYAIHKDRGQDVLLNLWLYSGGPVSADLSIRLDGGPTVLSIHNPQFTGDGLHLPPSTREANLIELDLRATNRTSTEVLVLDRLKFGSGPLGPPYPGPRYANWALGGLAGLLALPLIGRRFARPVIALAVALIVGAAADLRMSALIFGVHHVQPNPDTIAYQFWADQFRWWPPNQGLFCGCYGPREPAWIAIGHVASQLFGSSTFHLRATTTFLSIAVVVLAIAAARRRLSWPGALAVGVLVALNGNIISNATRGIRTELEMACGLILYLLLDRDWDRHAFAGATGAGLVGAALVLTRSFFLPVIIVVDGLSLLGRKLPAKRALVLLVLAVSLPLGGIAGHRYALYESSQAWVGYHKDPFLDTDSYARWNANYEKFEYGLNLPHPELFPTRAEYELCGPYCGPHITYLQYLFVLHTPRQVALDSLAGYIDILNSTSGLIKLDRWQTDGDPFEPAAGPTSGLGYWLDRIVRYLGVVGLVAMLLSGVRHTRNLLVPVMFLGILGFTTFLYHVKLIEPYYNVIQAWPFMFIAGLWALENTVRLASGKQVAELRHLPHALLAPFATTAIVGGISLAAFPGYPIRIVALLAAITAVAVAVACFIDAATGAVVLVATLLLLPGEGLAAGVAVAGLAGLLVRLRPALRLVLPALAAGPLALGAAASGIGAGTWRPHRQGLEMAVLVLAALTAIVLVSGSADRRREFLERLPLTLPVLAACALVALSFGHFPPAFAAAPGTLLAVTMPALVGVLASSRWPPLVRAGLALGVAASAGIYFVASGLSGALLGSSVWPAVLQEVAGHPLLGIGIGQLEPALLATNQGLGSGLTARSEYLQTAAEAGLVGLAGLLLLIVVAALAGIRRPGPARWALLGAVAVLILVMTVQSVMSAAPGIAASLALFGLALGDFTVRNSEPGGGSRLFSA
jgi:hypothetical protein